jgi:predicted RNA-binding Zn-ribbon protein involved in translation (DUF1610 family)
MKFTETIYRCEKCRKKLKNSYNSLNIVTSLTESSYWSRLKVQILHESGVHNDSTTEKAELCRSCTIALLKDAVKRVTEGERASAGTESSSQEGWR